MVIYELTHLFFRYANELVYSPKNLGIYCSYEAANQAIDYYCSQPGFCDNQDAFSIRERVAKGIISDGVLYEAIFYFHTNDYQFEAEVELGLYGDEIAAQNALVTYGQGNPSLVANSNLIVESIVNRCVINKKEWVEGFCISEL